ncbi:hypothetical protein Ahy_B06g080945 [Arachis hypogaea]|uniref:CCHC-type domain-containing protein n=1 Tax=Arachis hypogaea TaxID=3818 RepID=A0A444YJK9_ARAHY|nr:hypothetical protein Ahy_B06g080945 [Arachis hypogaea]
MHCYESEELDSVASDDEDSQQAAFPQANPDAPVRKIRLELGMEFENLDHFKKAVKKFNINIGRNIFFPIVDSTRLEKEKRESNKWRPFPTGDDPGNVYEVQCLPHKHCDLPPILPPVYKKQIGRPKLKRDKKNDAPKEPTPDPHRAPRKYGPITCRYCLKTGHNSRSCSKKKEAMAGSAGGQSSSQHPTAEDDEEEAARLEEMFWEETLEAVEAAVSQPPPETTPVSQPVPNTVRSSSTRSPTAKKPPKKKKNLRRPPPTTQQPQSAPAIVRPTTPTTTSPSPPASDVPPHCDTSNHASCLPGHYFQIHGIHANSRSERIKLK